MNKDITKYVGIDLGDKTSMVHVRNEAGEFVEETRLPTTPAALEREFDRQPPMRIAIEVGSHSRWVSRLLSSYGHEVVVADARKLRLIYENPRKSDRVDAAYLAKLVRLDMSLLSPVTHRGEEAQQHLAILRARDSLVQTRTQLVNHARGMVKSFGARLPSCSTDSFAKKARPALPEGLRPALGPVLESIQELTYRIRAYEQEIERLCEQVYPETGNMRQIRGVGALTALAYVLTLEDPTSKGAANWARIWEWSHEGTNLAMRTRKDGSPRPEISTCGACWWGAPSTSWDRLEKRVACAVGDCSWLSAVARRLRNEPWSP
jgi:transposase